MNRSLLFAALTLASLAFAQSPAPEAVVQEKLITPLAKAETKRSMFSRARLPAQARRIRVLDEAPQHDAKGKAFFAFAVDARHGYTKDTEASWRKDTIVGCVYVDSAEVFVKRGDKVQSADVMLGKKAVDDAQRCQASDEVVAAVNRN